MRISAVRWCAVVSALAVLWAAAPGAAAASGAAAPRAERARTALDFAGLAQPRGLAVDASGNVYVTDIQDGRVVVVPADGSAPTPLGFTGLDHPFGVAVDGSGNVYVADTYNTRVVMLPAGGGAQTTLGFTGLTLPYGVAVDGSGNVYVTDGWDHRVVRLPVGGGAQTTLGFTGLAGAFGVAVDGAGDVYVTDPPNNRVVRLPAGGGAQTTLGFTGLNVPYGVAVDGAGSVYVADTNNRVVELPADGGAQTTLGFTPLHHPFGVAADGWGDVYVTDSFDDRVATLTRTPPELRVTTSPPVPADIVVDGVVRDSWGLDWASFPMGPHEVCFGAVAGFTTPACQDVDLSLGAATTVEGAYAPKGHLRVLTEPAVASTITVDGVARNDWGLWTEVDPGTHEVCFGAVEGFDVPGCRDVVVAAGSTAPATTTGTFTPNPAAPGPSPGHGYLRATTSPAVDATISVDGTPRNTWGLDWLKLPVGSHEVCFGPALHVTAPACRSVDIVEGGTATTVGTYEPKGFLRVLTDPAVAGTVTIDGEVADAWGVWTSRAPGTYRVCFRRVPGLAAPPCRDVTVTAGETVATTGTYTSVP